MSPARLREDVAPWSFFLPVMLAVMAGVLLAGAVQYALKAVFPPVPAAVQARSSPAEETAALDVEATGPAADDAAALVEVGATQGGDVVLLPGPITSMREGADRACISDTIALRRPNGWEQGLENDAPLRCRASSP